MTKKNSFNLHSKIDFRKKNANSLGKREAF